jgi:hypothetical protein
MEVGGGSTELMILHRGEVVLSHTLPLGAVRIAAEPGRGAAEAARGRLVAEGRQADVLRAAGRLAEPASGVLLERVSLVEARGGGVRLEVEAFSVRGEW